MPLPEEQMACHHLQITHLMEAPFQERMQFLVKCSMSENVEALAFKVWRNYINNMFHSAEFNYYESGNNLFFFSSLPSYFADCRRVGRRGGV
jgi:hypothetical protein